MKYTHICRKDSAEVVDICKELTDQDPKDKVARTRSEMRRFGGKQDKNQSQLENGSGFGADSERGSSAGKTLTHRTNKGKRKRQRPKNSWKSGTVKVLKREGLTGGDLENNIKFKK